MRQKSNCPKEIRNLLVVIEDLRTELNNKAGVQRKRLLDPDVLELSQRLDAVLNEFYRITLNSTCD